MIVATGEIIDGEASPGTIGSKTMTRLIRDVKLDNSIKAVVLRIDSPGGSMFASEVVYDQLEALKATGRPVVASFQKTLPAAHHCCPFSDDVFPAATVWFHRWPADGKARVDLRLRDRGLSRTEPPFRTTRSSTPGTSERQIAFG